MFFLYSVSSLIGNSQHRDEMLIFYRFILSFAIESDLSLWKIHVISYLIKIRRWSDLYLFLVHLEERSWWGIFIVSVIICVH